ncbi:MAG: GIY-YIG nuclease family protein [Gammaproteobacteria bacterium]|nr:GIY-YIG nuclease family protein [Gammaproteobacteria bacterium]
MAPQNSRRREKVGRPAISDIWFVYMLECARGQLYTGITLDVAKRFEQHRAGRGAAYTRSNKPLRVVAATACDSRGDALRQEAALKRLTRAQKLAWARTTPWAGTPG